MMVLELELGLGLRLGLACLPQAGIRNWDEDS